MVPGGQHVIQRVGWLSEYRFWLFGDIHWGSAGCLEKMARKTIARIAEDPKAMWFGMGDFWDLVTWADPRWDPSQIAKEYRQTHFEGLVKGMLDLAYKQLKPIKGKCLGLLHGNHEYKYGLKNDTAMMRDLAEMLDVPFLGYSAFKDVVFADKVKIRFYLHHGAGHAQTKGGKLNKLLRFVWSRDADVIAMGHVHSIVDDLTPVLAANADCSDITQKVKLGIITGSYLAGYHADASGASSYVERAGMDPNTLGSPCIIYVPGTKSVSVEKPAGQLGRAV